MKERSGIMQPYAGYILQCIDHPGNPNLVRYLIVTLTLPYVTAIPVTSLSHCQRQKNQKASVPIRYAFGSQWHRAVPYTIYPSWFIFLCCIKITMALVG